MKGQAVDGVDDDGQIDFRLLFDVPCGFAADDAGFAGVGVDDVGLPFVAEAADFGAGAPVVPGMRIAHQVRREDDAVAAGAGAVHEGAFGAGAGAGEQCDVVAALAKALAGEEGVFLGSADDEAGDDVEDFHCAAL